MTTQIQFKNIADDHDDLDEENDDLCEGKEQVGRGPTLQHSATKELSI